MIYLMVDEDGLVSISNSEPSDLSCCSYPTVFRITATGNDCRLTDDIEVEVSGINGWEDVKERDDAML